jgi:histidyl-tRNA synthetase
LTPSILEDFKQVIPLLLLLLLPLLLLLLLPTAQLGSPSTVIPQLRAHAGMQAHTPAREAIEELGLMASYLEAFGTVGSVFIDLSLARGLDYYTGVIYEAVLVDGETKARAARA